MSARHDSEVLLAAKHSIASVHLQLTPAYAELNHLHLSPGHAELSRIYLCPTVLNAGLGAARGLTVMLIKYSEVNGAICGV